MSNIPPPLTPQARKRIWHAIGPGELDDLADRLAYYYTSDPNAASWAKMRKALQATLNHEGRVCQVCEDDKRATRQQAKGEQ